MENHHQLIWFRAEIPKWYFCMCILLDKFCTAKPPELCVWVLKHVDADGLTCILTEASSTSLSARFAKNISFLLVPFRLADDHSSKRLS